MESAKRYQKAKTGRSAKPAKPPARARWWLLRIVAVLLPVLLFLLLEIGLRIGGYGYSTGFFRTIREGGKEFLLHNDTFSLRFFPPELARWPASFKLATDKPADTCRIFIFGESAAMGDPQPAYSASRFLEVLLRGRFPNQKFEVVNLGITAINSHVILPIAQDCADQHGDLWIIYMGNNEMVGPFGAATVFGSRAPPLVAARLNLALQRTRIGQLLTSCLRNLGGKPSNTSWGGMEMFLRNQVPPRDPRKETVYRNFAGNLRDIVSAGLTSGAKVILSTMSVNLRDSPPFASLGNSNLPAADREQFNKLYAEALALQKGSNYAGASGCFEQAARLDSQFAELHYRWAECLLRMTNTVAREQYQVACDTDALPFRADTRINQAIREFARSHPNPGLALCDAEAALAQATTSGVAGDESFYEHVHFNFDGNYRLGKAWAEQVERMLPQAAKQNAAAGWTAQVTCEYELGLSVWNRHFVLQSVIRRMGQPPLSTQFNNAERLRAVTAEDAELHREQMLPGAPQGVRGDFQTLLQRAPQDAFLYEGLANFLEATGDGKGAEAAYRKMIELLPDNFYACLQLGRLLGEEGQPAQGQPFLETAARLRPSLPEGWHELGIVLAAQEKFPAALECMKRAEKIRPQDPANVCYTAKVLAKMKRRVEAIQLYRRAIQMRPDFWEAHFELGGELAFDNQVNEAMREYAEVLRVNPRHTVAHLNLGVLFVRQNRLEEGIAQFEEALKLEPANKTALDYLSQVRARQGPKP
jgi:tetratricopeptide (TPR) repeat protein